MTLTTHAVAGSFIGAVASQNLAIVAVAAFVSHFLLDSIPHWDYSLSSTKEDVKNPLNTDMKTSGRAFYIDLLKIGTDFSLGLLLPYLFFYNQPVSVLIAALIGALFAMAPDALQFVYWKFRHEPLVSLQKFHLFMHAKLSLANKPIVGILSQIAIICLIYLGITNIFI